MKQPKENNDREIFIIPEKYSQKNIEYFNSIIQDCREYVREKGLDESMIDQNMEHIILRLGDQENGTRNLHILKTKKVFFIDKDIPIEDFIKIKIDEYAPKIIANSKKY